MAQIEILPAFHVSLPAWNGWVPEGIHLVDLPEIDSLLIATYDLKSPTYQDSVGPEIGDASPVIVLTVVHLPTMTTRGTTLTGIPREGLRVGFRRNDDHDQVQFAGRRLGGGRVLLWYGRTSMSREPSPFYLRVLDASQAQLHLGTPVEILRVADGGGPNTTRNGGFEGRANIFVAGLGYYLGQTPMGVHRASPTQFTAFYPVVDTDAGADYGNHWRVTLATRNFTVDGTTITVDYSPWDPQAYAEGGVLTLMHGEGWPSQSDVVMDEFGYTHYVDETSTNTTYVFNAAWIWAYQGAVYTIRWDGTRILGVTHDRLWAMEEFGQTPADASLGPYETYQGVPRVHEGTVQSYALPVDRRVLNSVRYTSTLSSRIGQRPRIAASLPGYADPAFNLVLHFDGWWASDRRHPVWGEPSQYSIAMARLHDDNQDMYYGDARDRWRLGFLLGTHHGIIEDTRQRQASGYHLPWVQDIHDNYDYFYLGEMLYLRSGYIVATHWDQPVGQHRLATEPEWYSLPDGEIHLSVWKAPNVTNLETGVHRSRGHFS